MITFSDWLRHQANHAHTHPGLTPMEAVQTETKVPAADALMRAIVAASPNGITKSNLFALVRGGSDIDGQLLNQLVRSWADVGQVVVSREGGRAILKWVGHSRKHGSW